MITTEMVQMNVGLNGDSRRHRNCQKLRCNALLGHVVLHPRVLTDSKKARFTKKQDLRLPWPKTPATSQGRLPADEPTNAARPAKDALYLHPRASMVHDITNDMDVHG